MPNNFNTIPEALSAIANGELIIVVDEPDRENEGDLIMAAEKVTAETINFMATHGRGLICLPPVQNGSPNLNSNRWSPPTRRKCKPHLLSLLMRKR